MPTQPTPREQQVLVLRDHGLTRPQIAAQLGIKTGTVAVHLRNLFGRGFAAPSKRVSRRDRVKRALEMSAEALEGVQCGDMSGVIETLVVVRGVLAGLV